MPGTTICPALVLVGLMAEAVVVALVAVRIVVLEMVEAAVVILLELLMLLGALEGTSEFDAL
jgi:hypothetical protein